MFIQKSRIVSPEEEMNAAISIVRNLERRERSRVSSLRIARQRLAEKLRLGCGSLENLIRGRVKRLDAVIRDRLHALLIRELEAEIARLSHELSLARQGGASLAGDQVGAVEAHLLAARSLLEQGTK